MRSVEGYLVGNWPPMSKARVNISRKKQHWCVKGASFVACAVHTSQKLNKIMLFRIGLNMTWGLIERGSSWIQLKSFFSQIWASNSSHSRRYCSSCQATSATPTRATTSSRATSSTKFWRSSVNLRSTDGRLRSSNGSTPTFSTTTTTAERRPASTSGSPSEWRSSACRRWCEQLPSSASRLTWLVFFFFHFSHVIESTLVEILKRSLGQSSKLGLHLVDQLSVKIKGV